MPSVYYIIGVVVFFAAGLTIGNLIGRKAKERSRETPPIFKQEVQIVPITVIIKAAGYKDEHDDTAARLIGKEIFINQLYTYDSRTVTSEGRALTYKVKVVAPHVSADAKEGDK